MLFICKIITRVIHIIMRFFVKRVYYTEFLRALSQKEVNIKSLILMRDEKSYSTTAIFFSYLNSEVMQCVRSEKHYLEKKASLRHFSSRRSYQHSLVEYQKTRKKQHRRSFLKKSNLKREGNKGPQWCEMRTKFI